MQLPTSLAAFVSGIAGMLSASLAKAHVGPGAVHGAEHGFMHMLVEHIPVLLLIILAGVLVTGIYRHINPRRLLKQDRDNR